MRKCYVPTYQEGKRASLKNATYQSVPRRETSFPENYCVREGKYINHSFYLFSLISGTGIILTLHVLLYRSLAVTILLSILVRSALRGSVRSPGQKKLPKPWHVEFSAALRAALSRFPLRSSRLRFAQLLPKPWYVEFSAALRAALSLFLVRSFSGYLARGE